MVQENSQEVVQVVHNPSEDKPWEIKFHNIGVFKKARAILNYPVHQFETEEKALEVADMLRDIIKADAVTVDGEVWHDGGSDEAEFFRKISSDGDDHKRDHSAV